MLTRNSSEHVFVSSETQMLAVHSEAAGILLPYFLAPSHADGRAARNEATQPWSSRQQWHYSTGAPFVRLVYLDAFVHQTSASHIVAGGSVLVTEVSL